MVATIGVSSHQVCKDCFFLVYFIAVSAILIHMSAIYVRPKAFWRWWQIPPASYTMTISTTIPTTISMTTSCYTSVSKIFIGIVLYLTLEVLNLRKQCMQLCLHGCVDLYGFFSFWHCGQLLWPSRLRSSAGAPSSDLWWCLHCGTPIRQFLLLFIRSEGDQRGSHAWSYPKFYMLGWCIYIQILSFDMRCLLRMLRSRLIVWISVS